MGQVRRVYCEKKPGFNGAARDLCHEIRHYLGIEKIEEVRILIRYDVENISDDIFERACKVVFAEPPVDDLYLEDFPKTSAKTSSSFMLDTVRQFSARFFSLVSIFVSFVR